MRRDLCGPFRARYTQAAVEDSRIAYAADARELNGAFALERAGRPTDAIGVRGPREAELPGELAGVEQVRRLALVEHLVGFSHQRIEPTGHAEHRPAQHTMSRCNAKCLCGKRDEFSAGQRVGSGGDVPGLIPGGRPLGEAYEALRCIW